MTQRNLYVHKGGIKPHLILFHNQLGQRYGGVGYIKYPWLYLHYIPLLERRV